MDQAPIDDEQPHEPYPQGPDPERVDPLGTNPGAPGAGFPVPQDEGGLSFAEGPLESPGTPLQQPMNPPAEGAPLGTPGDIGGMDAPGGGGDFLDLEAEFDADAVQLETAVQPVEPSEAELSPEEWEALEQEDQVEGGSWLLSLDSDEADRAGDDCIVAEADELDGVGAAVGMDSSWTEEPGTLQAHGGLLLKGLGAVVLGMLGYAGWLALDAGSKIEESGPARVEGPSQVAGTEMTPPEIPDAGPTRTVPVIEGTDQPTGVRVPGAGAGETSLTPGQLAQGDPNGLAPGTNPSNPSTGGTTPGAEGSQPGMTSPGPGTLPSVPDASGGTGGARVADAEVLEGGMTRGSKNRWRSLLGLGEVGSSRQGPTSSVGSRIAGLGMPELGIPTSPGGRYRGGEHPELDQGPLPRVSPDEMPLVWRGFEIPMHLVDGEDRMRTPGVGAVRVTLTHGSMFNGRLHSVGEGRIWISTGSGSMSIEGERVSEVVHVMNAGFDGSDMTVDSLRKVRARLPGGSVEGHVLREDEDTVVIRTVRGSQVSFDRSTVEMLEVEPQVVVKLD